MYDDDRFSFLWLRECCGFEAGSNRRGFLLRSIVNEINILAPAAKTAAAAATRWSVEASMRDWPFFFSLFECLNRSLSAPTKALAEGLKYLYRLRSEAAYHCSLFLGYSVLRVARTPKFSARLKSS